MRYCPRGTDVRAAERALMALVPDGALMQRAAAGPGGDLLRPARPVYGSRVVVLAGTGDNGGDALFAGARLAARGARVTVIAAGTRLHEAGTGALRRSGGRVLTGRRTLTRLGVPSPARPDHRRHPRHRRTRRPARASGEPRRVAARRPPPAPWWSPRTCQAA